MLKHTYVYRGGSPGFTELLAEAWSVLVPPPPEPDVDTPLGPPCLLTQSPDIPLGGEGGLHHTFSYNVLSDSSRSSSNL